MKSDGAGCWSGQMWRLCLHEFLDRVRNIGGVLHGRDADCYQHARSCSAPARVWARAHFSSSLLPRHLTVAVGTRSSSWSLKSCSHQVRLCSSTLQATRNLGAASTRAHQAASALTKVSVSRPSPQCTCGPGKLRRAAQDCERQGVHVALEPRLAPARRRPVLELSARQAPNFVHDADVADPGMADEAVSGHEVQAGR